MQILTTTKAFNRNTTFQANRLLILVLLAAITLAYTLYFSAKTTLQPPEYQLKMEKSTGKNGKHANPKAREQAEREYQKKREELEKWDKKPNKTPKDKEYIKKLRKLLERLRQKKDFSGENHSQKHKGS